MTAAAIFTGDIVKSRALEPARLDAIFAALANAAAQIADWQGSPAPFMRFRGDGWQMALSPRFAFRAALLLRAAVRATGKGHDTRIGIGIGAARMGADLASSDGPAFIASGRALDLMKRERLRATDTAPAALRSALPLADVIMQGWTARQAQIVQALCVPHPPTQEALGHVLSISQQSVQKHVLAAHLDPLLEVCGLLEIKHP